MDKPFTLTERGNTYAEPDQRYVVSYILSYGEQDVASPEEAVARALALTRDDEALGTHGYVLDQSNKASPKTSSTISNDTCQRGHGGHAPASARAHFVLPARS